MSELFGKNDENSSMGEEILKALVGKVMDLWTLVKDMIEQIKKLADQVEGLLAMKEEMAEQKRRAEEFLQKVMKFAEEVEAAASKFDLPVERVKQLEEVLEQQVRYFKNPLDKTVRHHHLLGKAFYVVFVLVLISSGTTSICVWQWQRADRYADDDMRWRAVKLMTDPAMTKVVDQVESSSQADQKGFARAIEEEEDRRADLARNLVREQEARKRIDELEKQNVKKR
ncbi:MAG TPA: hypothetical protein VGM31_04225 [Puia sp.]|jgi:hypothetical protein